MDFIEAASRHQGQIEIFEEVKRKLNESYSTKEDLTLLGTECYLCKEKGHMATECIQFATVKGNLRQ